MEIDPNESLEIILEALSENDQDLESIAQLSAETDSILEVIRTESRSISDDEVN